MKTMQATWHQTCIPALPRERTTRKREWGWAEEKVDGAEGAAWQLQQDGTVRELWVPAARNQRPQMRMTGNGQNSVKHRALPLLLSPRSVA